MIVVDLAGSGPYSSGALRPAFVDQHTKRYFSYSLVDSMILLYIKILF